jgi:hypothetical protein
MSYSRIPYTATAPGADSNDYVLFSTGTAFPGSAMHQGAGVKKLVLNLKNSHLGTLKTSRGVRSSLNALTWSQISTEAIAAGTSTTSTAREYLLEPFADFKLEWTNGGSAQSTWVVDLALTDERGAS